jgi:glycosyltransferase involved in cell wall biosynthesis
VRRFLYITPYFPPQSQVGALRPLKFARHLPEHGWAPVVLCDLWPGAKTDPTLSDAIPESSIIVRDYSWRAARAQSKHAKAWAKRLDWDNLRARRADRENRIVRAIPSWLNNPELVPLGEHSHRMPYALRRAHETLERFACDAIVVNADPYAACLVGARLKRETGLPLVLDLRDPWAPCELRRRRRPRPIRILVDRLERRAVLAADRVVLNTETTWDDYRQFYPALPAEKFTWIRNHSDAELIDAGKHVGFDRFTLLFLGNFGRFIKPDVLLNGLAELLRRGMPADKLQLVVTGDFPESGWRMARSLGVDAMIQLHQHVPYREIGAIMNAADLLVLLIQQEGRQRLAAKLFDYLASDRPILAISENPELGSLLAQSGAGSMLGYNDVTGLADAIEAHIAAGRQQVLARTPSGVTSQEASAKLAGLLNEIT